MKKVIIFMFISLIFTTSAFSQEPEIIEVYDQKQVIVLDADTGEEHTFEKGDKIKGRIITEISSEELTVLTLQEDQRPALVQKIPVGKKDKAVKIHTKKAE